MHWTQKYIGRPYVRGDADCARLVCEVHEKEFRGLLPDDIERAGSAYTRYVQMQDGVSTYAEKTVSPEDGDVVLMYVLGRPSHIGVYCVVDNEPSVLHAMENAGMVVLHKIRDLEKYRLSVEGYYKWKC